MGKNSYKKRTHHGLSPGYNYKKKSRTLLILIIAAAAVGLLGGTIITSFSGRKAGSSFSRISHGVASVEAADIISKFNCACGNCSLTLANCDCDDARGAKEMKDFINYHLEQGKSPDHIVILVKNRYGHLR